MCPISAWKFERQDIDCKSNQHTEDELEDTIHPAVLAVFGQELRFLFIHLFYFIITFFLTGVSNGSKLELISIICFIMLVYCTVHVLHVDSMSRFCFKLVVLYVHMRWGDNGRQLQGCTQGEGCQAADLLQSQNLKDLDFVDII
jgi:hypothetical protein